MAGYVLRHAKETQSAGTSKREPTTVSAGVAPKTQWWTPQQQIRPAVFWD
jgi:hypothetical protein